MAKSTKSSRKSSRVIYVLFLFVILVIFACGIVIASGIYTNGYESLAPYYIKANGVVGNTGTTIIYTGKPIMIQLSGVGFKAKDWGNYSVAIATNPQCEIAIRIGDNEYELDDVDLTECFLVEKKNNNEFSLSIEDYKITSVLRTKYGENLEITNINTDVSPYIMTITAEDNTKVIINLTTDETWSAFGIELTPSRVVF